MLRASLLARRAAEWIADVLCCMVIRNKRSGVRGRLFTSDGRNRWHTRSLLARNSTQADADAEHKRSIYNRLTSIGYWQSIYYEIKIKTKFLTDLEI